MIMLQKIYILNELCSFALSTHHRILKKHHSFHKDMKQHNCFQLIW